MENLDFLIASSSWPRNREIEKFCVYAHRNKTDPEPVLNYRGFCERGVLDQLLVVAKNFYVSYINANTKKQICRL